MRFPAALAAIILLACPAAQAADMAAHRALYQLKLGGSRGDVTAASGTMGYEVVDSCDGWAVRQRLQMTVTNQDGQDIQMVSDYATWEAKNGLSFRFHMKQTTEGAVTSQTDGEASLNGNGGPGEAHYTAPKETTAALPPGTLFPMAHTVAILAAAKEGKKFLGLPLFDGTSENGAQDSSIAILGWHEPAPAPYKALAPLPFTRVHIAFFERGATAPTPDYEVGMKYWDNGVADDLRMDFGDFVMNGKMSEFSPTPHHC
ncbi:MAG: cell envelope integrity EipB family protein [Acetobacteraceae bacterium]|nr:cell envelope integrity EipB family protein [Acetobacteraceae bacterium]